MAKQTYFECEGRLRVLGSIAKNSSSPVPFCIVVEFAVAIAYRCTDEAHVSEEII